MWDELWKRSASGFYRGVELSVCILTIIVIVGGCLLTLGIIGGVARYLAYLMGAI